MLKIITSAATLAFLISTQVSPSRAQPFKSEPYRWKNIQIVGGGFVDGIVFHPTAKGLRYARTDMGGAYRWTPAAERWQPILDWMPYKDLNLMGVESIAVDPSDPSRVYLACGTYTNAATPNGAILRSDDQGRSFQRADLPFKFGGNENGRGNGERLSVDPHDGRILYLGTRHDGLWRSTDRAATWHRVQSFPDVTEPVPPSTPRPGPDASPAERQRWWSTQPHTGSGIVFTLFAKTAARLAETGPTSTIYAGISAAPTQAQPGLRFQASPPIIVPPARRSPPMELFTSLTAPIPARSV